MITIDGSIGEGGGQILRSALALSMITGRPMRIERIRAGREKPGLMRQHLTAVSAAATVSSASVEGASIGSQSLIFRPGTVRGGSYTFSVGTAGSTTLVLQTVLPALLRAEHASELLLEGGTHNPFAPPFDFLQRAFLPLINRMGPRVEVTLERAGFYPAGGGRIRARIEPAPRLTPLHLSERGEIRRRRCTAIVAGLPRDIAQREIKHAAQRTNWPGESYYVQVLEGGPGNILFIEIESEQVTEVFTGFGQRGKPGEAVVDEALQGMNQYLSAGVPVGGCLADQLLLPLALAGEGSFVTLEPTAHSTTNMQTIGRFLEVPMSARQRETGQWEVRIGR